MREKLIAIITTVPTHENDMKAGGSHELPANTDRYEFSSLDSTSDAGTGSKESDTGG